MTGPAVESVSRRLAALGLELPAVPQPLAAYAPAVVVGDLVHTAGQLPTRGGALTRTGKVGAEVSVDEAAELARTAALNALAAAASVAGSLDRIAAVVKLTVFVASAPDFTGQPAVANGASELIGALFGEAGRHARSAVGVVVLPLDAPVEIELVARLQG